MYFKQKNSLIYIIFQTGYDTFVTNKNIMKKLVSRTLSVIIAMWTPHLRRVSGLVVGQGWSWYLQEFSRFLLVGANNNWIPGLKMKWFCFWIQYVGYSLNIAKIKSNSNLIIWRYSRYVKENNYQVTLLNALSNTKWDKMDDNV